ncbi:hypothetical protein QQF64_035332 [Cirrhinus molitorella]|uniref:Uncharacterized protein n=1 Tax=Cirrhinus molitorella TaxID=172907 RepID=A0ABR3NFQ1_9TELE
MINTHAYLKADKIHAPLPLWNETGFLALLPVPLNFVFCPRPHSLSCSYPMHTLPYLHVHARMHKDPFSCTVGDPSTHGFLKGDRSFGAVLFVKQSAHLHTRTLAECGGLRLYQWDCTRWAGMERFLGFVKQIRRSRRRKGKKYRPEEDYHEGYEDVYYYASEHLHHRKLLEGLELRFLVSSVFNAALAVKCALEWTFMAILVYTAELLLLECYLSFPVYRMIISIVLSWHSPTCFEVCRFLFTRCPQGRMGNDREEDQESCYPHTMALLVKDGQCKSG